jgi:(2Fe-2S) ferredoxin
MTAQGDTICSLIRAKQSGSIIASCSCQNSPSLVFCYYRWPLTLGLAYSILTTLQRKRYLFVCINRRAEDNPKGCCAAKDSEEVYRALKAEVAMRGLAKLGARVCTSSCLDQCETGVTVLVEPDHFFYGRVTVADVPEIVDGLVNGQPVKRLVVTAEQPEA